jgi:hypothetical protein
MEPTRTERYARALEDVAIIIRKFDSDDFHVSYPQGINGGVSIYAETTQAYKQGSKILGGLRYKMTDNGRPYLRKIILASSFEGDIPKFPDIAVDLHPPMGVACEKVPTGRTITVRKRLGDLVDVEEPEMEWRCAPING